MKKLIFAIFGILALNIVSAAYAADDKPADKPAGMMQGDMMDKGMMCEKCPCCQKMMEGGKMGHGKMKGDMQCPMMKDGAKDGMKGCCCQKMMEEGGKMQDHSMPSAKKPADSSTEDHTQHHPAQ